MFILKNISLVITYYNKKYRKNGRLKYLKAAQKSQYFLLKNKFQYQEFKSNRGTDLNFTNWVQSLRFLIISSSFRGNKDNI